MFAVHFVWQMIICAIKVLFKWKKRFSALCIWNYFRRQVDISIGAFLSKNVVSGQRQTWNTLFCFVLFYLLFMVNIVFLFGSSKSYIIITYIIQCEYALPLVHVFVINLVNSFKKCLYSESPHRKSNFWNVLISFLCICFTSAFYKTGHRM